MRLHPFVAAYPDLAKFVVTEDFFSNVREAYPEYKGKGIFAHADRPALYVYEIKTSHRQHLGLVGCADIHDFLGDKIRKHENTLSARERQQMELFRLRSAIVKPVLLTYPGGEAITRLLRELTQLLPVFYSIRVAGEEHSFWQVGDTAHIEDIRLAFQKLVPHVYVADGHHRIATAVLLHEQMQGLPEAERYDHFLSVFFSSSQLDILPFHRLVTRIDPLTHDDLLARLDAVAEVTPLHEFVPPAGHFELVCRLHRHWYRLRWKPGILERYSDQQALLDTRILNDVVMEEILGIHDVRHDDRVVYIEGSKSATGVARQTAKYENGVAFFLHPIHFNELQLLADAGIPLPPKSTWFEPRIKNGLLVQEF